MMKMKVEQTKLEIRKRLFASGKLPDAFEYFLKCPTCHGTGRYCRDYITEEGGAEAVLIICRECGGERFTERNN